MWCYEHWGDNSFVHPSLPLCVLVLNIHKRPAAATFDISFPMRGWRGMADWVRSSEDRVMVPREALSHDEPGKNDIQERPKKPAHVCAHTHRHRTSESLSGVFLQLWVCNVYSRCRWWLCHCDWDCSLQKLGQHPVPSEVSLSSLFPLFLL